MIYNSIILKWFICLQYSVKLNMIVFSETELKKLFVQGQIDSGDLSIYL